jgi:hypothetical protein
VYIVAPGVILAIVRTAALGAPQRGARDQAADRDQALDAD